MIKLLGSASLVVRILSNRQIYFLHAVTLQQLSVVVLLLGRQLAVDHRRIGVIILILSVVNNQVDSASREDLGFLFLS